MDFPSRLKQLRTEHKLTQERLGRKISVTKVSISGYESGNRTPDLETLQRLADTFEVDVDYLLGRSANPSNRQSEHDEFDDPELNLFFKDFANSPEERKREMLQFWEFIKEKEKGRKPGDRQGK